MVRDEVEAEMRTLLGDVPSVFATVPDDLLTSAWGFARRLQFGETLIPGRFKHLIGLAVAAATHCPYGTVLERDLARVHGASEADIAEAVHIAGLVTSLGVQLAGLGADSGSFATEAHRMAAHIEQRHEFR